MKVVVFSPHTDDAIFSLGAYLSTAGDTPVTIASPFAAIPDDDAGKAKHKTLRREHRAACATLGNIKIANGPFLDDVYPPSNESAVTRWLLGQLEDAGVIYVPVGIHHPDHYTTSNLLIGLLLAGAAPFALLNFYEELPYRVLYPEITQERLFVLRRKFGELIPGMCAPNKAKERAVRTYKSQTDEDLIPKLMVDEHIWKVVK